MVRRGAITPERLYPLTLGSAWSYDVDAGDGDNVLAVTRVTTRTAEEATVQGGEGQTRYALRADGIFRSDRDGYLLRMPLTQGATWSSGGGMQARVSQRGIAMTTTAGTFADCVEVTEQGAESGVTIVTTYCPDVGPVEIVSSMTLPHGSARVIARLRGYQVR